MHHHVFWRSILSVGVITIGSYLFASHAFAAGWVAVTSPTGTNLQGVDCMSTLRCIAVGETGTVLYTTSGRTGWTAGSSSFSDTLHDVDVVLTSLAFAVGANGTILKSTNSGATWTTVYASGIDPLYDIHMASTTVGWAVGEDTRILKTSDGGANWTNVATSGIDARAVDATSANIVWVAGTNGEILKSTNGGTSWTSVSYATTSDFLAIDAITASIAYVAGEDGLLLKTTDGGSSWTPITVSALAAGEAIADLVMTTTSVGTLVGNAGTVASTTDGSTWNADTMSAAMTSAYGVAVYAVGARVIVGAGGDIFHYDNVGPNAPTGLAMDDGSATSDPVPTFTWDAATDDEGSAISHYDVEVDGAVTGTTSTTTYTLETPVLTEGEHTVVVRAVDVAGNEGDDASVSYTFDITAPTVGNISPTTATAGTAMTLSANVDDAITGVASCTLYVNGASAGDMTVANGSASQSYTFSAAGSASVYAVCTDDAGNDGEGDAVTITVSAAATTTETTTTESATDESTAVAPSTDVAPDEGEPADRADMGDLIKMNCEGGEDINDPCRAVYYYGEDGKRHAFPNEKVYFTWYSDFKGIIIVTDDYMATLTLGSNVTYAPGARLVKFPSVRTVYAVGESGELRGIASESVAAALFGDDWNMQIDDISEAFYTNYTFGTTIDDHNDYDADAVAASVDTIDDIL